MRVFGFILLKNRREVNLLSELVTKEKYALEQMINRDPEIMFYDLADLGKSGATIKTVDEKITINVQGQIVFDLTDDKEPKTIIRLNPM